MAGETIKTEAICLDIRPWSQTSHIVTWLTPNGKLGTVVKGAVRPKSAFLGQYDLNCTCEILYYARAKGELHALRDCVPLEMREGLRTDYRRLALAGYFRGVTAELAPVGPDCQAWYDLLSSSLSSLLTVNHKPLTAHLVRFDLKVLELAGLAPDLSGYDREAEWSAFSVESGAFGRSDGRCIRVSREVAGYLSWLQHVDVDEKSAITAAENPQTPLDAVRVIGVFYQFHLDRSSEVRRSVVGMIAKN